jgi:hypothetical protein
MMHTLMLGLDAGDSSMDGSLSVGRVKVSEQTPSGCMRFKRVVHPCRVLHTSVAFPNNRTPELQAGMWVTLTKHYK